MYNPLNILYSDLPTDLSLLAAYLMCRPLSRVIMVLISCLLNPDGELLLSIFLQGIVLLVKMLVGIPPPLRRVSMTVGPVQQMDRGGTRRARAAPLPPPSPDTQPAEKVNEPNLRVTRQEADTGDAAMLQLF